MRSEFGRYAALCSELVSVASQDERFAQTVANLEAIGKRHALVLMEIALPAGLDVSISNGAASLEGTVTSCRWEGPLGYSIELRLRPESQWSRTVFEPAHMLDLSEVKDRSTSKVFPRGSTENFVPSQCNQYCTDEGAAYENPAKHLTPPEVVTSPELERRRPAAKTRCNLRSELAGVRPGRRAFGPQGLAEGRPAHRRLRRPAAFR